MSRRHRAKALVVMGIMLAPASNAVAQENAPAQGPRFLLAAWSPGTQEDASDAPVLQRHITLELSEVTLDRALKSIIEQADLEITYSSRVLPLDRRVSLHAAGATVGVAMARVLAGLPVDVSVTAAGGLAILRRRVTAGALVDTGAVVGQVTDSASGSPIVGATVVVERTRQSGVTDAAGRYRITRIPAGTYTLRARFIGYRPVGGSVVVSGDAEVAADFVLAKSAQELDQVVVTGTIVPTEVKALPTPVTVITENDITAQKPRTVQELFRQAVPTAVSWDFAAFPTNTVFSVRGASTINPGSAQMKVFVDGVEAASPSFAPTDPNSIERIEVVRGPQAATIYGSDAVGGVIQIFTKRGDPGLNRPRVQAEAALGGIQTPYADYGGVLRQNYTASLRGGVSDVGYNIGGGYSHTDDYVPDGEQSGSSMYGGIHFARGMITIDASGRYSTQNNPQVYDPALYETGLVSLSKPFYQHYQYQNQTFGTRFTLAPTSWWRHTVSVGVDRLIIDGQQTQPRLTTPEDTLLFVNSLTQTKTSVGYNTSVQGTLVYGVSGSLTAGVDHYSLPSTQFFTSGAFNTTGTIQTAPGSPFPVTRTVTNNTGYFGQAQLGFRDVLFLTGGLRAEENTNFGHDLGTPVSPRAGLTYVQQMGDVTLKLRGSYGRAIRAPTAGQKLPSATPSSITLANTQLGPERQKGWDAGLDIAFHNIGSLGVTYFDQTADGLIQAVLLGTGPVQTFQNQNVGRVKNSGIELEATLNAGPVQLKGQYGYTRSRIGQLAPGYAGDLRVGDQSWSIPRHTAGGSVTYNPRETTTAVASLTYVGSWTNYDQLAQFRCFGATGPCQPTSRDFLIAYPGFLKVNARISHQITQQVSGFVGVENLTNSEAHESTNIFPVTGRVSTVGLHLQY